MRALLPNDEADPDVDAHYATDWSDSGGVRVNFISSVDGAATVANKSAGLHTPGDSRLFHVIRDLADIVVAGAGTVRTEGYASLHYDAERQARRQALGYPPQLTTAVVSRRLDLDADADLFANADLAARTVVITCAAAPTDRRAALSEHADVIVAGQEAVDLAGAFAQLRERGHRRILCEGGPRLFADAVAAGVVDELCLSIAPLLAGPGAGRIVGGLGWANPASLRLHALLEEDGALFARYRSVPE